MNSRTTLAIKNIGVSLLLKGGSILISFLLVPITLDYLDPYEYGIWLTLNSVLSWIYLFDIGLGNGLRNKLAEALATKDYRLGKIYVSTTFFFMTIIVAGFYIVFLAAQLFLNWHDILNVEADKVTNLNSIVTIVFGFFCLSFIFKIIGNVYMARQLPAVNDFLSFLGNILSLVVIYILTKTTSGSFQDVAMTFSGAPALIYAIAIPITFLKYKEIAPSFKAIKLKYFNSLISIGFKFMVIQISVLIIFMTSNLIISNLFGPQEVTPYNIANKLFTVLTIGFTIILTPFWSAITDAYTKGEVEWIEKNVSRLRALCAGIVICGIIIALLSPMIYHLWIGNEVEIPISLSFLCCMYALIQNWNNIYAYTINGLGKLNISLICACVSAIVYIPMTLFLGRLIGINGIVISLCISLMISAIILPIQYQKLIKGRARGIWNK